jgi:hypothetical protein
MGQQVWVRIASRAHKGLPQPVLDHGTWHALGDGKFRERREQSVYRLRQGIGIGARCGNGASR